MMPINLRKLHESAATKPHGYVEDVLSRGEIRGDHVWLSKADYDALLLKYSPRGLGDRVARIAKPIARAIDGVLGTDLEQCGGCADRQALLNTLFPTKSPPEPPRKPTV